MSDKIKTGFVFDPVGSGTIEEEVEMAVFELRKIGLDVEVKAMDDGMVDFANRSLDLLIVDYGGVSLGGAYDLATYQIKEACQWADERPGSLMVIWTKFTSIVYQDELEREFGHLDNVLLRFEGKDGSYDFMGRENPNTRFNNAIRTWFGLTGEIVDLTRVLRGKGE